MSAATIETPEETPAVESKPFEFSVPARVVGDALKALRPALPGRSTLPVLHCVLVDCDGRSTRFTATNLDQFVTFTYTSSETEPSSELGRKIFAARRATQTGKLCIEHSVLSNLLKSVDGGDILFRNTELGLPILGRMVGDKRAIGPLPQEFPPLPEFPAETPLHDFDAVLRNALVESIPFTSEDATRYILQTIFLDAREQAVVASNGSAMLVTLAPSPFPRSIPLHVDAVKLLASPEFASHRTGKIGMTMPDNPENALVRIDSGPLSLVTKIGEGTYPNWKQVIPTDPLCQVAIPAQSTAEMLKALSKLPKAAVDAQYDPITLTLFEERQTLRIESSEGAFVDFLTLNMDRKASASSIIVRMKRCYLQAALKMGLRHFRLTDEMSAVVFADAIDTPENPANRRLIAMPIRIA